LLFVIIGIALLLLAIGVVLLVLKGGGNKKQIFKGYLEVRSLLDNGKYTSLEAPDLSTFVGQMSLKEFISISLGAKAERIFSANVPLGGILIQPATVNNRPMLQLVTNGACRITDSDGNAILQKRFMWEKDLQLIFSLIDNEARIEITYRINED